MFNVLLINNQGKYKIQKRKIIPRVNDSLDMGYSPFPKVESVLPEPTKKTLKSMNLENQNIEAIVTFDGFIID